MIDSDATGADPDSDVDAVVEALAGGEVVVLPTDTVYGLAADPRSAAAVASLFELKGRAESVPIAVLVASADQAAELVEVNEAFHRLAAAHWPGGLTLVAPVRAGAGLAVGTASTLGVRCPDDDFVRAIAERFGAVAATSANRHGEPPVVDGTEARRLFRDQVSLIVDDGPRSGLASTVVDVTGPEPVVLREGPVAVV